MRFLRGVLLIVVCITVLVPGITMAEKNTLVVGTKEAPPFAMKATDGHWTGISINLWEKIADELNFKFEFREFDLQGLLNGVTDGSLDVGVAALTMTPEREITFDFTHSFYATGLGIAVPFKEKTPWMAIFRGFLTLDFLKVVAVFGIAILFVGTLVWWFEKKKNAKQFDTKPSRGIAAGFWWSAVTMTTVGYGDKAPVTIGGRIVALIWMFSAFIITIAFTATIVSIFTVSRLETLIQGPEDLRKIYVGTVSHSTSEEYLEKNQFIFRSYQKAEYGLNGLKNGEIQAFVYDKPLLHYLINRKFRGKLEVLPFFFSRQDYALALQAGSPLREEINRRLLQIKLTPWWQDTLDQYLRK